MLKVTAALDSAGIQNVPLNDTDLYENSRTGELFLAWREKGESLQIFCGGRIGEDFVQRINNVYIVLAIPNLALGREVLERIKTDPNNTLEQIMYRIFRSSDGKSFLPMARHHPGGSRTLSTNVFAHPISKVTSGMIK